MKMVQRTVAWFFLAFALLLTVGPIYWVASSSLKSSQNIISPAPTLFPTSPTLTSYGRLLFDSNFLTQLKNSVVVAAGTTLITVAIVLMAAFGAYRGHIRWLRNIKFVAIFAFVFPTTLLVVPVYQVLVSMGLVDSLWSVIAVNIVLTAPFCLWLIEGYFDAVPRELEEAAYVDGATRWQVARAVLLPLILPGIATIAIFTFVTAWTEFTFSSVLIIDTELKTLPLGLADILAQYNINWSLLTSYTTLAMVPGIIFFALAGRYFIEGLVAGALKT